MAAQASSTKARRRRRTEGRVADVTIRDAAPGDLEAVARIKVENWTESYGALVAPGTLAQFLDVAAQREEFETELAAADTLLLVADDELGGISGFALAFAAAQPDPWLESLHVARDRRGRGIGTLLMRELARRLAARGLKTMRLGVVSGNDRAGRLYVRLGARMIGTEPAHWAPAVTHELYRWADMAALIP